MRSNPISRFVACMFVAAFVAAGTNAAAEASNVDVGGAATLLEAEEGLVVLDVRTPGEFEAIHIDGAKNIDVDAESFHTEVAALDRDKSYLVHCAAGIPGGRSARAVEVMEELGFKDVHHFDGGINAWKAAGKTVVGTAANAQ